MSEKSLNDCADPRPSTKPALDQNAQCLDNNPKAQNCEGTLQSEFYKDSIDLPLQVDEFYKQQGGGEPLYCDPMITGKIVNDHTQPPLPLDRSVVNRYSKGIRFCDEAVKKLFSNIDVIDSHGKILPVPIIWGSQERAVQVALQENVRKDNTGVVDRITLPIMSIYTSGHDFTRERFMFHEAIDYKRGRRLKDENNNFVGSPGGAPSNVEKERWERDTVLGVTRGIPVNLGYTLTVWTMFWEDMNQILEQIATKFSPIAYIRIQGITNWETIVKLDSVTNNVDIEPGENKRVIKFQFVLTAETFVPQPIIRRKAALKTRVEIVDGITDDEINSVLERIETAVGELNI